METALAQIALVLRRHLLVGRDEDNVVEPSAHPAEPVPVLKDMGVHDEGLAGAGRTLEGDGAKVLRRVVRHGPSEPVPALRRIQFAAEPLRVGEVAAQVMLREQQGQILVRLPGAAMLAGHTQAVAESGDIGVVLDELLRRDLGTVLVPIEQQSRGVLALVAGVQAGGRQTAQPAEHVRHALGIAEFMANEAMQDEAVLERGTACLAKA